MPHSTTSSTGYVQPPLVPRCGWSHCWWFVLPPLHLWADVSIPPDHLVMISFSQLSFREQGSAVTLYEGGRPPYHERKRTDFIFPFLLSGASVHLIYHTGNKLRGFLFRMMFTVHQVSNYSVGKSLHTQGL